MIRRRGLRTNLQNTIRFPRVSAHSKDCIVEVCIDLDWCRLHIKERSLFVIVDVTHSDAGPQYGRYVSILKAMGVGHKMIGTYQPCGTGRYAFLAIRLLHPQLKAPRWSYQTSQRSGCTHILKVPDRVKTLGGGDRGSGHHDLRRSHVIWRFGAGSPAEGTSDLRGSMCGARFWPDSRLTPSRRQSRREHLPERSRGGCCKPAP